MTEIDFTGARMAIVPAVVVVSTTSVPTPSGGVLPSVVLELGFVY